MKSIIFSDLHLHDWQEFSSIDPESGLNNRFLAGLAALRIILNSYDDGDTVIFCGDFFHDGSKLKPEHVYSTMEVLRGRGIPRTNFLAIPGQHDYSAGSRNYSCLDVFVDYMSVVVEPGPHIFNGNNYYLIPHSDHDTIMSLLAEYKEEHGIIIGHFLADELLASASFRPLPNSVGLQYGEQPPLAFIGDFHTRTRWKSWISVGSPYHQTFSDAGRSLGGFWTKEGEDVIFNSIGAPTFVVIENSERFFDSDLNKRDYFRVHVKSEAEMKSIRKKLDGKWNIRFVVEGDEPQIQQARLEVNPVMKPSDVIQNYCDYREKPDMVKRGIRYIDDSRGEKQ